MLGLATKAANSTGVPYINLTDNGRLNSADYPLFFPFAILLCFPHEKLNERIEDCSQGRWNIMFHRLRATCDICRGLFK